MFTGKPRGKYQYFINNLKVYSVSKLVLALAMEANRINPSYNFDIVKFKLDSAANAIINKLIYDY